GRASALLQVIVGAGALRADEALFRGTAAAGRVAERTGALIVGDRVAAAALLSLAARALTAEVGALTERRARSGLAVVTADRLVAAGAEAGRALILRSGARALAAHRFLLSEAAGLLSLL